MFKKLKDRFFPTKTELPTVISAVRKAAELSFGLPELRLTKRYVSRKDRWAVRRLHNRNADAARKQKAEYREKTAELRRSGARLWFSNWHHDQLIRKRGAVAGRKWERAILDEADPTTFAEAMDW